MALTVHLATRTVRLKHLDEVDHVCQLSLHAFMTVEVLRNTNLHTDKPTKHMVASTHTRQISVFVGCTIEPLVSVLLTIQRNVFMRFPRNCCASMIIKS